MTQMMNWARDIGGINPSEGVKKEEVSEANNVL